MEFDKELKEKLMSDKVNSKILPNIFHSGDITDERVSPFTNTSYCNGNKKINGKLDYCMTQNN